MPNETGTAFLVDPMGHAPRALDEEDFKHISQYLDVVHGAHDETCEAIDWLLHLSTNYKGMDDHEVFAWMVRHYLCNGDRDYRSSGVLANRMEPARIEVLTEHELTVLGHTLTAIRSDCWFAGWLDGQVETIATGSNPGERFPTPLQIAATLSSGGWIERYEEEMEIAREIVRMRPDLLCPSHAKPSVMSEAPSAPEPAQPSVTPPPKNKRPRRNVRKGASHAA